MTHTYIMNTSKPKKLLSINEALAFLQKNALPYQSLNSGMHIRLVLPTLDALNYYPTTGKFNLDGQPAYPLKGLLALSQFLLQKGAKILYPPISSDVNAISETSESSSYSIERKIVL